MTPRKEISNYREVTFAELPEFVQDEFRKNHPKIEKFYRVPYNGLDKVTFPKNFKTVGASSFYYFGFFEIPAGSTSSPNKPKTTKGKK